MQDLVFLLYELPAPLGKRSNRISNDMLNDPAEKQQGRSQDRYLVYKNIVMKKRDALDLLSDLKIKVHADPIKQIHFVDVFKALIKRKFKDANYEYKLSPKLQQKIKNQWGKKHKKTQKDREKSDFTAIQ